MKKLLLLAFLSLCCAGSGYAQVPGAGSPMVPVGPAGIQANLTAITAPGAGNDSTQGYSVGSLWQNANTGEVWMASSVAANAAVWDQLGISDFWGYVANRWNIPWSPLSRFTGAPTNPGNGTIRFFPATVMQNHTISQLGGRVVTGSVGGNCQFAVYRNNNATNQPTGTAVASTSAISVASNNTSVNATVNGGTPYRLYIGRYWYATNCDNVTVTLGSWDISAAGTGMLIGDTVQVNNYAGAQAQTGYSFAFAFVSGSWPDMTSNSVTVGAGTNWPVVQELISAVP